jgi:hypothetical protein
MACLEPDLLCLGRTHWIRYISGTSRRCIKKAVKTQVSSVAQFFLSPSNASVLPAVFVTSSLLQALRKHTTPSSYQLSPSHSIPLSYTPLAAPTTSSHLTTTSPPFFFPLIPSIILSTINPAATPPAPPAPHSTTPARPTTSRPSPPAPHTASPCPGTPAQRRGVTSNSLR